MTTQSTTAPSRPSRWLRRYVNVEPAQIAALLASFAMFFAFLFAWYIVRPVRDEIAVTLGKDALHDLLQSSFAIMVVLVPLFSFVAPGFLAGSCRRPSTSFRFGPRRLCSAAQIIPN